MRLGLDDVDLLLIHWPNQAFPSARAMAALGDTRRKGLTRHIGVSNFTIAKLAEAVRVSAEPIVTNQIEYHPYLDQTRLLAEIRRPRASPSQPTARSPSARSSTIRFSGRSAGPTARRRPR